MTHEQMAAAFSSVIHDALIHYENQTPVYYYLTYYGSWVFILISVLTLILALENVKKNFHHLFVPLFGFVIGIYGIQQPRPNIGVYYGHSLAKIAYPNTGNTDTFLDRADFSNPICCSIKEAEYLYAKRIGFQRYADSKAKALVDLVVIERKSFLSDGKSE